MDINKVFNIKSDKQQVICPPNQVFVRPDFEFLLTIGGNFIHDEKEYDKFRNTLRYIGETEFYIKENLGATVTDRSEPLQSTIKLTDNYQEFQEKVRAFDPPFGWYVNHFFVWGQNSNWGIYISEFPTINIIGCDKTLSDKFRETFLITDNGYAELKEFIANEFQLNPDQLVKFIKNYKIND